MNVKSFFIRCTLILFLIITFASAIASPVQAGVTPGNPGSVVRCPICDSQPIGSNSANVSPLQILDFSQVNPDIFETNVAGASSDPAAILKLVQNAVTVWESALGDLSDLNLYVGWAEFGANGKISQADETLPFSTASAPGQCSDACNPDDRPNPELPARPGFSSAIAGDVIGLHICGAPTETPSKEPCSPSQSTEAEATILFNSEILEAKDFGRQIKLFLDSNPFNSRVFGPIQELGVSGTENTFRVGGTNVFEKIKEPFVVDLFTVALHEVGHALGYSEVNGLPPTAHINKQFLPDVLSEYIPFSARKCPSRKDVESVVAIGSYAPSVGPYQLISSDPCGSLNANVTQAPL